MRGTRKYCNMVREYKRSSRRLQFLLSWPVVIALDFGLGSRSWLRLWFFVVIDVHRIIFIVLLRFRLGFGLGGFLLWLVLCVAPVCLRLGLFLGELLSFRRLGHLPVTTRVRRRDATSRFIIALAGRPLVSRRRLEILVYINDVSKGQISTRIRTHLARCRPRLHRREASVVRHHCSRRSASPRPSRQRQRPSSCPRRPPSRS